MSREDMFHPFARVLHWLMAIAILAMLFIGAGMVSTLSTKHTWLLAIHKPLGITIFVLALIRLGFRLTHPAPPLPADLPVWQKLAAHGSHVMLYALMIAMPLIGWGMLSAGDYPVTLGAGIRLPQILPANPALFAWLREAHRYLAWLFFLTFLAHMGAALMHGLIRRDGVLRSMTGGRQLD
ncbi:cytochrome b [Luteibacter sp. UNCMF366Tsu5.1]|uniref:cytochrome b n=1 Tax=Luteibacter sp. UNCMF366Tsu5.1 TaxID=1502758 RepID=UPI0009087AED|nr:cytochrome b [Luteibacter sp. UNCMF366Tsu5.1]SFW20818.1 Cytochrome b561 [Luteibacter sp. UNCMF366Tsu5.1]